MMNQKTVDFPPHPSPLPRGKRVKLENQLRGRGDNRNKIDTIISDRVKYSLCVSARLHHDLWSGSVDRFASRPAAR